MSVWHEREGAQGPTVLLLHGLGATGAVWRGVVARLHAKLACVTLVVDLPGHGASSWCPGYSTGGMAAAVAPLAAGIGPVHVIAHSLGVYVGLALASSWFNCGVASVTGIGPKVTWSEADVARMGELARRPVRYFATAAEAAERYRRSAGLELATWADESLLERGAIATEEGHRLAADPATMAVGAPSFSGLVSLARCPVRLACGERDTMVTITELRQHDPESVEFAGLGHNAHVESPDAVVDLFEAVRVA
jgi:pimeloyl-ACP methyl ester carboxylesterase